MKIIVKRVITQLHLARNSTIHTWSFRNLAGDIFQQFGSFRTKGLRSMPLWRSKEARNLTHNLQSMRWRFWTRSVVIRMIRSGCRNCPPWRAVIHKISMLSYASLYLCSITSPTTAFTESITVLCSKFWVPICWMWSNITSSRIKGCHCGWLKK